MKKTLEQWKPITEACIRGPQDLRKAYEILKDFLEEHANKHDAPIVAMKQRIREVAKAIEDPLESVERVFGDYDGYTAFIMLDAATKEEAEREFREYFYIKGVNSQYDCTGKPFTVWHKIVKKSGRFFLIHHVCFDV